MRLLADAAGWSVALEDPLPAEGIARLPIRVRPEDRPRLHFRLGVRRGGPTAPCWTWTSLSRGWR